MERKYFRNLTDTERKQLKESIFKRLNIADGEERIKRSSAVKFLAIGIAASIIVVVGLIIFTSNSRSGSEKVLIARTSDLETRQIKLADGSEVLLNGGSELYVARDYMKGTRNVFVTGNAFFKVRKFASNRKFVVHAKDIQVTVLGTQFNVNARSELISVALTEGKVQVTSAIEKNQSAYLLPGDKVQLSPGRTFLKEHFDTSLYSAWTKGVWTFKNLKLADIMQIIHEYYNVDVEFVDKTKMNRQMTAIIPVTTLEGLVQVISATLEMDIVHKQNRLSIE